MNIVSDQADATLSGIAARCAVTHPVSSLYDLRAVLDRATSVPMIDLIGHSTRGHRYLRLGPSAIDMLDPAVARFFHELGASRILERLGVRAIRLLGCETAVEIAAQKTMVLLASVLGVAVFGTTRPLMKAHYTRDGFDPSFSGLLIEASELPYPRRRLITARQALRER